MLATVKVLVASEKKVQANRGRDRNPVESSVLCKSGWSRHPPLRVDCLVATLVHRCKTAHLFHHSLSNPLRRSLAFPSLRSAESRSDLTLEVTTHLAATVS